MIKSEVSLRFHDMDMFKHMYNGRYTEIFDIGKSDFFRQVLDLGYSWLDGDGFITAATTNNFYSQIKISSLIELHTTIEKIGNKSLTLLHKIVDKETGEIKAESHCVMVAFNFRRQETMVIPDLWREKIEKNM